MINILIILEIFNKKTKLFNIYLIIYINFGLNKAELMEIIRFFKLGIYNNMLKIISNVPLLYILLVFLIIVNV